MTWDLVAEGAEVEGQDWEETAQGLRVQILSNYTEKPGVAMANFCNPRAVQGWRPINLLLMEH